MRLRDKVELIEVRNAGEDQDSVACWTGPFYTSAVPLPWSCGIMESPSMSRVYSDSIGAQQGFDLPICSSAAISCRPARALADPDTTILQRSNGSPL